MFMKYGLVYLLIDPPRSDPMPIGLALKPISAPSPPLEPPHENEL